MIFDIFRITPEIGVVYPPVLLEHPGIPIRSEKSESSTRDPTFNVIHETLYYEGLAITMARGIDSGPSDWTWLEHVRIDNPKYTLRSGLRVGDHLNVFWEKFGLLQTNSNPQSDSVSFYSGSSGETGGITNAAHATVTLEVDEKGAVMSVDFEKWGD